MGTVPLASVEDRSQNGGRVAAQWALQILKMSVAVQFRGNEVTETLTLRKIQDRSQFVTCEPCTLNLNTRSEPIICNLRTP